MEKSVLVIGALALSICGLFPFLFFTTLIGGCAGWAVGLLFQPSFDRVLPQLGIHASLWDLGVVFGFFGGFLKTKVTAEVKEAS